MKHEIQLSEHITEKLIAMPETGMGYQTVNLILENGKILINVTVLNSSIALLEEDIPSGEIIDVSPII